MALATYSDLTTAYSTWELRTLTSGETDEAILIAESKANRKLAKDYRRQSTATINTDAFGYGTLPTGFVGMVSLTRDVLGSVPLKQVSWNALISRNPYEVASDAQVYAISGTQFATAPVTDDNFLAVFDKTVPALTASNTTNWLLALAPEFYLFMGLAQIRKKYNDFGGAAPMEAMAMDVLDEIVSQGNVAAYANAEMTLDMVTP